MTLRIRRGTSGERDAVVTAGTALFEAGEPIFTTNDGKLYIGDSTDGSTGTQGGVLINPSIIVDSEVAAGDTETVIVDRSRSRFLLDSDSEIDLREANNFRIDASTVRTIAFLDDGVTNDISDGQSGYIVLTSDGTGTITIAPSSASPTVFTPAGGSIESASSTTQFVSYTVAGSNIYLSNVLVSTSP